jgi:putative copper resistance protein D
VSPDDVSVILRALNFVALFQAAGAAYFLALFGSQLKQSGMWICRLGLIAALAGVILAAAHQSLDAARMADDYSGLLDTAMLQLAWLSGNGAAHLLQILGLLALAIGLGSHGRPRIGLAVAGAIVASLSPLLTGHTSHHALRWALAPLLATHLLIVAFWFGALAPLIRVTQREAPEIAACVVAHFSSLAGWLVPLIAGAGLAMALILAPDIRVLQRPYGQLLLTKAGGFALLMLLAAYNKWQLTPALVAGDTKPLARLRRVIVIEYLLLVAVLTTTAILTSFYSPEY